MDITENGQEDRDLNKEISSGETKNRENSESDSESKDVIDNSEPERVGPTWEHGRNLSNENLRSALENLKDIMGAALSKEQEKLDTYLKISNNYGKK
jgi:hypothetical protein